MLKKYFVFLSMIFLFSIQADSIEIAKPDFVASPRLGKISLFHDEENGFFIVKDNKIHKVQNCFVDKEIRSISNEKLGYFLGTIKDVEINGHVQTFVRASFEDFQDVVNDGQSIIELNEDESLKIIFQLAPSAYLLVTEMSDGEYCIRFKTRLLGGGLWGAAAGCWIGKFVASAVCHTAIFAVGGVVSFVATPEAGGRLIASLEESTLGVPIEASIIEAFTTTAQTAGGIIWIVVIGPDLCLV